MKLNNRGGVIVLGASGFIGTRLIRQLTEDWEHTTIRAIDIAPPRERLEGVEYLLLDVREPLPPRLGEGAACLYNLAAIHRTPGHPTNEYYDTNIGGALNATAFAAEAGINQIVFTSSISVYGPSEELLDEQSPLHPVSAYGRSKRFAEEIHRRWREAHNGRRLVIVRPGVVFGPGEGGNYTKLARALKKGMFVYPGRHDVVKSGGYVDELLGAVSYALDRSDPYVLFNFAYPTASTIKDIVKAFSEVMGCRSSCPTIPTAPMLAVAAVFEGLDWTGFRNSIHRERIMKLLQSTRISPGWLLANGYSFKTNLRSALERWSKETDNRFD
jgi:nucleoside-diphosphate-sugar epimerase